jgi:hypothetical protein
METEMQAMVLAGELDTTDLPDCCNDMQTWAETGHLCKPGLDCAGLLILAPAPSSRTVGVASGADPLTRPSTARLSTLPDAPWRPPTGA